MNSLTKLYIKAFVASLTSPVCVFHVTVVHSGRFQFTVCSGGHQRTGHWLKVGFSFCVPFFFLILLLYCFLGQYPFGNQGIFIYVSSVVHCHLSKWMSWRECPKRKQCFKGGGQSLEKVMVALIHSHHITHRMLVVCTNTGLEPQLHLKA